MPLAKGNELSKPIDLCFSERGDVFAGLGAAKDGADRDEQDFVQGIIARPGSRIFDMTDDLKKTCPLRVGFPPDCSVVQ